MESETMNAIIAAAQTLLLIILYIVRKGVVNEFRTNGEVLENG